MYIYVFTHIYERNQITWFLCLFLQTVSYGLGPQSSGVKLQMNIYNKKKYFDR